VVALRTEEVDEFGDDPACARSGVSCSGTSPAPVTNSGSDGGVLERGRDVEVEPELIDGEVRFPVGW
jgi:hypothetical protein